MKRAFSVIVLIAMYMAFMCGAAMAADASDLIGWYRISSDDKYIKYFAPDKVKVAIYDRNTPVSISATTRTGYTEAGAKETLDNYKIDSISPKQLAYSTAEVRVNPQDRTITYLREIFYDSSDNPIWSKSYSPPKPKEINSQQFDEAFYDNIVDSVFSMGEDSRSKAADRWYSLWERTNTSDETVSSIADTTTMRMDDENLIYWEWREFKNSAGDVTRIRFQKKTMNIRHATVRVVADQVWTPEKGWVDQSKDLKQYYRAITKGSDEAAALKRLRQYVKSHKDWVNRYEIK